jgi:3-hexulose-6-phosphate synthase and related proteins
MVFTMGRSDGGVAKAVEFPSLQVALDFTSWAEARRVVGSLSSLSGSRLMLEAGTPLIKGEGIYVVRRISEMAPWAPVVADLKTMDTAELEVSMAAEAGADAAVVSGVAPIETVRSFIEECRRKGMMSFVDSIGLEDPAALVKKAEGADVIVIHRGIDEESAGRGRRWSAIKALKDAGFRVAVAGGMDLEAASSALEAGADVLVVGRDITRSADPAGRVSEYLKLISGRGSPRPRRRRTSPAGTPALSWTPTHLSQTLSHQSSGRP